MSTIVQADDSLIERNRVWRARVFFATPFLLALIGGSLFSFLFIVFLGIKAAGWIGFILGAGSGLISFLSIKHKFVVQNDTTGMLVTIDQLQTLLGKDKKDAFVVYGPGTHFSLPWEARFARNNIPVTETTEEFNLTAICIDGTLTGKGSFRLRPDFTNPINYLSGVGAVAGDLKDLIVSFINTWLAKKTMQQALDEQDVLYQELHDKFVKVNAKTDFEDRFGILLGDITVSQLLMSEETQRTRGALNEARVVSEGAVILLGFKNLKEQQKALAAKTITQDDIDRARRDFRIISGNMEGATVNRYEVDIKGLSPEAATALTALLNNPQARTLAAKGIKGQPKKGTST